MKKFLRIFLTLTLITVLGLSSTINSFAMSSTEGGTWTVTDWESSGSLSLESLPCKVIYLPYSKVAELHNADLNNSTAKKVLISYWKVKLTESIAKDILAEFGVNLVPYVSFGWLCYDLAQAAIADQLANRINDAYNSGCGMSCTLYNAQGTLFWRFRNWDGYNMPEKIEFRVIPGYSIGDVTVGEFDLSTDY